MTTILIASTESNAGRTAVAAGLGACLAEDGRNVRLLRVGAASGADAAADDDAATLATVPGCDSPGTAVSEQDAQAQASGDGVVIIEAVAGDVAQLAQALSARVVLVSSAGDDLALGDLASTAASLGDALLGVIVTRQQERRIGPARAALEERNVTCLGVLPEDRLLAGPNVGEMSDALHASRLVEGGDDGEAVEFVMLGPISADPGQPYFLQHGAKAVVNRFDKMDLHLAALATDPDCLILTGGQQPSPYLIDRLSGGDGSVAVLLSPDDTARTVELIDELYGRTRFGGRRKIARGRDLIRAHADLAAFA